MIHWCHLLWIVPLAAFIGFVMCAVFTVGAEADRRAGRYDG